MPNLVVDPTFANLAAQWETLDSHADPTYGNYDPALWNITNGTATVTKSPYSTASTGIRGRVTAPEPGEVTVSALVSAASVVTIALVQDDVIVASATQSAPTPTLTAVSVVATAVAAADTRIAIYPGTRWDTLTVSAPAVLGSDPDPEPVTDPLVDELAPRVAAYLGITDQTQARAHLPVVIEFVREYVRGSGMQGGIPTPGLKAVIVSATSRLVSNPEQLGYYQTGDYSERPAVFNGYTLAEIGVLHRYRKRAR